MTVVVFNSNKGIHVAVVRPMEMKEESTGFEYPKTA